MGVGPEAQTAEVPEAHLCLPYLRNGALGQIVIDPETGEETEEYALYLCRRCADSR